MCRQSGFCARRTLSPHLSLAACRCCLTFSLRSIDDGASSLCGISRFMATINVYASGAHHFGRSRL